MNKEAEKDLEQPGGVTGGTADGGFHGETAKSAVSGGSGDVTTEGLIPEQVRPSGATPDDPGAPGGAILTPRRGDTGGASGQNKG
jgi:hypothetical protein